MGAYVCCGERLRYKRAGDYLVVRLDEGERIMESLEKICTSEKVVSGVILSIVGAVKAGTLIYRRGCQAVLRLPT